MRHAQRFSQRLVRRTSARVSITIFCLTILTSGFGTATTFPSSPPGQMASPYWIEFENLIDVSKAYCRPNSPSEKMNNLERQDMSGFGQGWSGNAHLFWRCRIQRAKNPPLPGCWGCKPDESPYLTVPVDVPAAGTYEIVLHYTTAPDYCGFFVSLSGQSLAGVKGYSPKVAPKVKSLGQHKLTAGRHELKVQVNSPGITQLDQASYLESYFVGLDCLELRQPAPIKKPSPPTTVKKPGT